LDETKIKRKYACAASLPTTMAVIAGFMGIIIFLKFIFVYLLIGNNALEYLLQFGEIIGYVGYNVLLNFFERIKLSVNPQCQVFFFFLLMFVKIESVVSTMASKMERLFKERKTGGKGRG
jgi:hypothetical protein